MCIIPSRPGSGSIRTTVTGSDDIELHIKPD
jgi:hypothetical protein